MNFAGCNVQIVSVMLFSIQMLLGATLCSLPGLLVDQKEELNLRRFENAAWDLAPGTVQKTHAALPSLVKNRFGDSSRRTKGQAFYLLRT